MTTNHLSSRIRRRSVAGDNASPLLRQWGLLEWLSSEPEGVTVSEAAEYSGVHTKTVRRDLILLRKLGFDLDEVEEERGRKRWRILHSYERLRSKKRQYQAIREGLDQLLMQAEKVGDKRLHADLNNIRQRVKRRCR